MYYVHHVFVGNKKKNGSIYTRHLNYSIDHLHGLSSILENISKESTSPLTRTHTPRTRPTVVDIKKWKKINKEQYEQTSRLNFSVNIFFVFWPFSGAVSRSKIIQRLRLFVFLCLDLCIVEFDFTSPVRGPCYIAV